MRTLAGFLSFSMVPALFGVTATESAESAKRIRESTAVLREIIESPDRSIPRDVLEKARCVGVVPSLKRVGLVLGGEYGKGVLTCRVSGRPGWSALSTIRIEGGNIGLQIGAGETDVVFVIMNERGTEKLLRDRFTVGGDASAMAGPVGRSAAAATDARMHAEILSYSRSHGVFAGITLNGATLRPDNDDNREIYGHAVTQEDLLHGKIRPTSNAMDLLLELNRGTAVNSASAKPQR
jgi:lipid-binding SYLF domain-containing protein